MLEIQLKTCPFCGKIPTPHGGRITCGNCDIETSGWVWQHRVVDKQSIEAIIDDLWMRLKKEGVVKDEFR